MPKAVVIGAGIGGIATAIRLAVKGYDVTVFEANESAGGKLSEIRMNGFRFDAGPSLFTMPHYVDELFQLAGKNPRAYFNYSKLDVICRYFYEDGTEISAFADARQLAGEIVAKTSDDAASVLKFMENSARIYDITHHVFLERSLHRLSTYLRWSTVYSALRLPAIDALRTMNKANSRFFNDSKTIRFFNRYATYNGSNPYQAPATLNIIPHFEQHFGAYFPDGGMQSIVRSLLKLASETGVKFSYRSKVTRILTGKNRVTGIEVNGKQVNADVIVSNMDVWFTYRQLLNERNFPKRVLRQERSSSALIFYWGISKRFEQLDLHNIFFSEDYEDEFRHIWQHQTISNDPTVYINISSKRQPADAPQDCENWFVMINVPANSGQNWDMLIAEARQHILKKLSRMLGEDISKLIVCEDMLDPRKIEQQTSSYQGSLYGSASNNRFAAFFRHANFSSKYKNLYFTGGSVHPGGGIPLALLSAKIVDGLIK